MHFVCHTAILFTQELHALPRRYVEHQCPQVEIRMTVFSAFRNIAKIKQKYNCVSQLHVQFGTQLCVTEKKN
jgi:hypothetical protein